MSAVWVFAVVGSILCTFVFLIFVLIRPRNKLPPMVQGWPVVGNAFHVDFKKIHITLNK